MDYKIAVGRSFHSGPFYYLRDQRSYFGEAWAREKVRPEERPRVAGMWMVRGLTNVK